jgi:penicillin G amidase
VAPEKLPRLLNPPTGYIVSANQRMVEKDFPHVIGHDYVNGYRAYRISQRLQALAQGREKDMLALQLDSRAGFYELYRRVALDTLERSSARQVDAEVVASLRRQLTEWDGQAEVDSVGLAFLVEFRRALAARVLSPFFARCREQDEGFVYGWKKMDVPLLRLLSSKIPELLPYPDIYDSWKELLAAVLVESAQKVMERARNNGLEEPLHWGDVNRVYASHPFSQAVPWLRHFLDMRHQPAGRLRSVCALRFL